jgi:UDP-arabinose 4-epimerase
VARILVTGGRLCGQHCAKLLAAAGHECVVFDNLSSAHREFVRSGKVIERDICNAAALEVVFFTYKIDAVMHFVTLA